MPTVRDNVQLYHYLPLRIAISRRYAENYSTDGQTPSGRLPPGFGASETTMSQQLQAPQQAQQTGVQGKSIGQTIRGRFDDSVPAAVQNAVLDLDRVETVCEWLDYQATHWGRPQLAGRAEDVSEIAHLQKQLLLRESPFAEPVGQAAQGVIQQAIAEFQSRATEPEAQDAVAQLQQTLESLGRILAGQQGTTAQSAAQQPMATQQSGQQSVQQPAQQPAQQSAQQPMAAQQSAQQPTQQPAQQSIQQPTQQLAPVQQPMAPQSPTAEMPTQRDPYAGGR